MAFAQDLLTRIVNVNFGFDVIVVFVNDVTASFYAKLQCTPKDDNKVKRLENFVVTLSAPGTLEANVDCSAFRVSANFGEFMETLVPDITDPNTVFSTLQSLVFTIGGDEAASLDAAKQGTHDYLYDQIYGSGQVYPDGLLWGVSSVSTPPASKYVWKMRYGKHRDDENTEPPNKMVQCYPTSVIPETYQYLAPPFGFTQNTYGYQIDFYRLDRTGTGQVYVGTNRVSGPSQWWQVVADIITPPPNPDTPGVTTHYNGVPFGDQPPLIGTDVPKGAGG